MKIPLIAVVGPTASGKTALSVALAKRLDGEIVSCDSMQIYRDMHIASAAPDPAEREGVPHHLLEFLEFDTPFSVADYVDVAHRVIADIYARGKAPLLVGGTGLYVNSLIDNVLFTEEKTDDALRQKLTDEYQTLGGEKMLQKLAEFDPDSAARIHPNNQKRVIRAFEIYLTTGRTMSGQIRDSKTVASPYIPYMIGLTCKDRSVLYERINKRVDLMVENGLLAEAKAAFGRKKSSTSSQAIGHKEFFPYFEGEIPLADAVANLKTATRRYAKRQLTWFGRDERIQWIYIDETSDPIGQAVEFLERNGYFG